MVEDVRSQAMGHMNGRIHECHYQNQVVNANIVTAFLETPSNEAIVKLMGHMSFTRDPNTPAEPTAAQRRQVQGDEVVTAEMLLDVSTKALRDRHGSVAAARSKARGDLAAK